MNILVVQLYTNHIKDIALLSSSNIQKYCSKYDYDYKCYTDTLDSTRHPAWSKIRTIQESLGGEYDWVWWIDADAFVANDEYVLKDIITEYSKNDVDIIFTDQKYRHNVNSGSMLVRNSEFSKQFFDDVYSNTKINPTKKECCWEQDSINKLLFDSTDVRKPSEYTINEQYADKIVIVDNHIFNSVYNPHTTCEHLQTYKDGDFVIHFAGPVDIKQIQTKLKDIGL